MSLYSIIPLPPFSVIPGAFYLGYTVKTSLSMAASEYHVNNSSRIILVFMYLDFSVAFDIVDFHSGNAFFGFFNNFSFF